MQTISGEAVKLPMRVLIDAPLKNKRPDSQDPIICEVQDADHSQEIGGWGIPMEPCPNYVEFLQVRRSQNPNLITQKNKEKWKDNK
ncbi:MAG: hypothetical protein LBE12_16960 [Planctomycetaceae bacterium]|jgi:hypothetical protein|nr:hypothetical protein [Planctomycetaceae bacterium]